MHGHANLLPISIPSSFRKWPSILSGSQTRTKELFLTLPCPYVPASPIGPATKMDAKFYHFSNATAQSRPHHYSPELEQSPPLPSGFHLILPPCDWSSCSLRRAPVNTGVKTCPSSAQSSPWLPSHSGKSQSPPKADKCAHTLLHPSLSSSLPSSLYSSHTGLLALPKGSSYFRAPAHKGFLPGTLPS